MKSYSPEQIKLRMQIRNVEKHLRIADATRGHERDVNTLKAVKFAKRYGMETEKVL